MHASTGVCQFDANHGLSGPQTSPDALAHPFEPAPAMHMIDGGNADSLFDQLMKEAQPRRATVAANPYFVLGRITRDTVDMLINGLAGLGRHAVGSFRAIDRLWQIGPTGALAQAPESPCGAADASSPDTQGMHWKLDALTPAAFWACAKAKGLDQDWFRGRLVVLIEPEVGAHDAAMLAGRLRWNSRNQILERSDRQLLDVLADGIAPGERARQVSRLLHALNDGIRKIGSVVKDDPSWEQVWQRVSRHMREPSLASSMASFIEKINQLNEMLGTREIGRAEAERLRAARQNVIREAEALDRIDRKRPEDLPALVWQQLEMLRRVRIKEDGTDFLILEPEAGRRFVAKNPDREAVVIMLAGAQRSSFATSVPELRIRDSMQATDKPVQPGADVAAQPVESGSCEVAGDCARRHGLRWELDALTPEAFWNQARAQGLSREWFHGKAIVLIEPEDHMGAAMKLASELRWKDGDPMMVMLSTAILEEMKKKGQPVCGSVNNVPGKNCIGLAEHETSHRCYQQSLRFVQALHTGTRRLRVLLPANRALSQRYREVDSSSFVDLYALFDAQLEAYQAKLAEQEGQFGPYDTRPYKLHTASLVLEPMEAVLRERDELLRILDETLPIRMKHALEQLRMHRASRINTDRTDFIVFAAVEGRRFLAEEPEADSVIVELRRPEA